MAWGDRDEAPNRYDPWEIHRNGWQKGKMESSESNPLYDIPGMEHRNYRFRKTELQILEENAAFFSKIKGGEELAKLYAEKVARLKA